MNICKKTLCALLSVLMVVCMLPAIALPAAAVTVGSGAVEGADEYNTYIYYDNAEERLSTMTKYFDNGAYALYCDEALGIVAYQNLATGEALFTNPWDMSVEPSTDKNVRISEMTQIVLTYLDSSNNSKTINSYQHAALKGQITVKSIKNGVRVEYAIGERSSRILCPMMIEESALEEKILTPLREKLSTRDYTRFMAFYNTTYFYKQYAERGDTDRTTMIEMLCPVSAQKNINIYTLDVNAGDANKRWMESLIMEYCPDYSFEEMDNDYDYVNYVENAISPPVFQMALEYVIDENGLSVTLPGNGLRYDETAYRIIDLQVLPYMGACNKDNEGYTFLPDGSGALYALDTPASTANRVYGEDYSLVSNVSGFHNQTIRMPVFGQVETMVNEETGVSTSRGYLAIIEQGASLASIAPNHLSYIQYSAVKLSFVTRQNDTSRSGWSVYAGRRYTDDYKLRYILLTDDAKAQSAGLRSYYECSWMGMACAYRDYLEKTVDGFNRLTDAEVKDSIPLYIETFGCVDTVKKIASMPVTVSVALTSFEDIEVMYDYLSENGVKNVKFKLTGYANGGYYSETPYGLKWESAVGGRSGFKKLLEDTKADGNDYEVFPDFNFVYTSQSDGGSHVNMKKNAARTIDNRYTTKRVYSATQQALVSYYQMVLSPATYSKFYEKLGKKYAKFEDTTGISLATLGSELNSDYNEKKTVLREEAQEYVLEALGYFKSNGLNIMLEGGNAFTWGYADHILGVSLDSSRYTTEYASIPFMGVVLHGYVQFTGTALNMEGNLAYAMLKAMENGASAYFILSYANTQLLKEDVVLSQNYSVRYDIWQSRLVEIYQELNAVLADVQTKLIIGHNTLEGSRVPDEDELLQDIADAAAEAAEVVREKIAADRQARVTAWYTARNTLEQTLANMESSITGISGRLVSVHEQRLSYSGSASAQTELINAWNRYRNDASSFSQFERAVREYVVRPFVSARTARDNAATQLVAAKRAYDTLVDTDANEFLQDQAQKNLHAAIERYVTLHNLYNTTTYSITESAIQQYIDDTSKNYNINVLHDLLVEKSTCEVDAEDVNLYILGRSALDALINEVVAAKQAYDAADADQSEALSALNEALDALETQIGAYAARYSVTAPVLDRDAYVAGEESAASALVDSAELDAFVEALYAEVNARYENIGMEALFNAYRALLADEGLYNPENLAGSLINLDEMIRSISGEPEVTEEPEEPTEPDEDDEDEIIPDPPKSKYSIDNSIVLVTYGDDINHPYKSILLNFNDYAVQTTINGIVYTIEPYGYLVIYY